MTVYVSVSEIEIVSGTVTVVAFVTVYVTDTVTVTSPRHHRDLEPGRERNRDMTVTLKVNVTMIVTSP